MTRAITLAELADEQVLSVDSTNSRIGIGSTAPTAKLDVNGTIKGKQGTFTGVVTASSFVGDGANLTGVSGFATALSADTTSILNSIFKTPRTLTVGTGVSVTVESDTASGNIAFMREKVIHVGAGSTFHVGSGTTLLTNILSVF